MVTESLAEKFKEQMLKPDLVFITKENEAEISREARELLEPEVTH